MKGVFYIDAINATRKYGVFISEKGFKGIVGYPGVKPFEINDWAEEEGLEVELEDLRLEAYEFEISFSTTGPFSAVEGFVHKLMEKTYVEFFFPDVDLYKRLRMLEVSKMDGGYFQLTHFSIRFSEDAPLEDYVYEMPFSSFTSLQGYKLDGKDISRYGIAVLQGSESSLLAPVSLKEGLVQESSLIHGVIADEHYSVPKEKDVQLNLLLRASTPDEFQRNLQAFIYDLIRDDARELFFEKNEQNYLCYYKGMQVSELFLDSVIWCEFQLTLCIISNLIEKRLYLFVYKGSLKASDDLPTHTQGAIILGALKGTTSIEETVTLESDFNPQTGRLNVGVSSINPLVMSCENGFFLIQKQSN